MRTFLIGSLLFLYVQLFGQIGVNTNFEVLTNQPIDTRDTLGTIGDTTTVAWKYPGLVTYMVDVAQHWYYTGAYWIRLASPLPDSLVIGYGSTGFMAEWLNDTVLTYRVFNPNQVLMSDGSGHVKDTTIAAILSMGGAPTGSGVDNQVAVWSGTSTLDGSSTFLWNGTNLAVGTTVLTNGTLSVKRNAAGALDVIAPQGTNGVRLYSAGQTGQSAPAISWLSSSTDAPVTEYFAMRGAYNGSGTYKGFQLYSPSLSWISALENAQAYNFGSGLEYVPGNPIVMQQNTVFGSGLIMMGYPNPGSSQPADGTIRSGSKTAASGADIGGSDLYLQAGNGTGNSALKGNLYFQTPDVQVSGSTIQPWTTKMTLSRTGQLVIGVTPSYRFDIGTGGFRMAPQSADPTGASGVSFFDSDDLWFKGYNGTTYHFFARSDDVDPGAGRIWYQNSTNTAQTTSSQLTYYATTGILTG